MMSSQDYLGFLSLLRAAERVASCSRVGLGRQDLNLLLPGIAGTCVLWRRDHTTTLQPKPVATFSILVHTFL
jgi:hypothetical protein